MALFGKKKESGRSVNMAMVDGVQSIPRGLAVSVTMLDSGIEIKPRIGKNAPAVLSYDQITGAACVSETEVSETEKSVVGRAVVGGVLLGPLGAIVGGMSGVGSKKAETSRTYFVINYATAGSSEPAVLSFEVVGATMGLTPFLKDLKHRCGLSDGGASQSDNQAVL